MILNCRHRPAEEKQQRYGEIATRLSELGSGTATTCSMPPWAGRARHRRSRAGGNAGSALAAAKAGLKPKEQGYLLTAQRISQSCCRGLTCCDSGLCVKSCIAPTPPRLHVGAERGQVGQYPVNGGSSRCVTNWHNCWASKAAPLNLWPQGGKPAAGYRLPDRFGETRARPAGGKRAGPAVCLRQSQAGVELQPWDIAYYE